MTGGFSRLRSLPLQLVGLLSLALLPLGAISLYQTSAVLDEARSISRDSLMSRTAEAAAGEREIIQQAMGAAKALGAAVATVSAPECMDILRGFISGNDRFIFAGFIETDGMMRCNSAGVARDFSGTDSFEAAMARQEPIIEVSRRGAVTGQSVVLVSHPVRQDGNLIGFLTLSIPHQIANALLSSNDGTPALELATINANGDLLSATGDLKNARDFLPRDVPLQELFAGGEGTFQAVSGDGRPRYFAVTTMVPGRVAIVGSWPVDALLNGTGFRERMSLVFPVLMWIAGIIVAYFGVQRLVIRHVRDLRSAMRRYALGELRGGSLTLDNPPQELKDTERAFNRMVLFLAQAEAQQEQDLRDKEVLLREVHHRVKNNLQMIASIMNMQARSARTPEARFMLAGLQRRVRGLAMLHRTLYTTPDTTTVDAAEVVAALVQDLIGPGQAHTPRVDMALESVPLFPDQAVPLSMLVSEALTNAVKYLGKPKEEDARIRLSLSLDGQKSAELVVENTKGAYVSGEAAATDGSGIGARLMAAFVQQLDGQATVEETDRLYRYRLQFTSSDFDSGTDRLSR